VTDEHELTETADRRARDQHEAGPTEPLPDWGVTSSRDIREESAEDADAKRRIDQVGGADAVRVPTADETAEAVRRAQRGYSHLNVVPWLVKVFTPRVGRRW